MIDQSSKPAILLTHPISKDDILLKTFQEKGFEVVSDPMIETKIRVLSDEERKDVLSSRKLIFTSKRGVEYFLEQFKPADVLDKSFICVGKKTAMTLERNFLKPWWVSSGKTAGDLVDEIREYTIMSEERWTALLGDLADDTIVRGISDMCKVSRHNTYHTIIATQKNEATIELLKSKKELMILVTSASCFQGFMDLYGDLCHANIKFASIGPKTNQKMEEYEMQPDVVAPTSTYEGLLYTLTNYFNLS